MSLRFEKDDDADRKVSAIVERLTAIEERLKAIPYQLECMRRLQQIEDDLHELRINAAKARFAREGEEGYIPKQSLGDDRWFTIPLDESQARSSTIRDFGYIERRLNEFVLPVLSDRIGLCIELEHLQHSMREEARNSVEYSLNKIALSCCCLVDQLHEMLERLWNFERAKEIEDKRK